MSKAKPTTIAEYIDAAAEKAQRFAAFKTHLGFMPTPSAMKPFEKDLAPYKTGKGSI